MGGPTTYALEDVYQYLIVFTRFAGFFAFAPIFSEHRINGRLRMMMTLVMTLIMAPAVSQHIPASLAQQGALFDLILIGEFILGAFAALIGRILLAALDIAGALIGFQMSLANAFTHSAASSQQAALPSAFLTTVGVILIFVSDFHHVMIHMIIQSYTAFQPGDLANFGELTGDMAQTLIKFTSASFLLGLQVGAPVTILGVLMFAAGGIINRLMPQIQVFFILQPVQILLGFVVLFFAIGLMMSYFLKDFTDKYQSLWNVGG